MAIDATVIEALRKRVSAHNSSHDDKVKLGTLKRVFERGVRSYERVMFKGKKTESEWAMGRVDNFLHVLANGEAREGRSPADCDLLPEGHQMKRLAKAGEFDESKHRRDGDGRFAPKGGGGGSSPPRVTVNQHKARQEENATYRAYTTSVLPETRWSQIYAPAISYGLGIPAGMAIIAHSAATGSSNIGGVRNRILGWAARKAGSLTGKAGNAVFRSVAAIPKVHEGGIVPGPVVRGAADLFIPNKMRGKFNQVAPRRLKEAASRLHEKGFPTKEWNWREYKVLGRRINPRRAILRAGKFTERKMTQLGNVAGPMINHGMDVLWSDRIAAIYRNSGRTPMERMVNTSPLGIATGTGLGWLTNQALTPAFQVYETWKPSQRVVERAEKSGLLRKMAILRAYEAKLAKQYEEREHPRDERGRWTAKHTAAVVGAAAGAAAIGAGLVFGRRSAINAAKRVFETAVNARTGADRTISAANAKKAIGSVVFHQGMKDKAAAVMGRIIARGTNNPDKMMDAQKLKNSFSRVMESQDRLVGAWHGVKALARRTTKGIEMTMQSVGADAGKIAARIGKDLQNSKSETVKDIVKGIKQQADEFSKATLGGKAFKVAKLVGELAVVGAAIGYTADVLSSGYGTGWKIDKGIDATGFHFALKIRDKSGQWNDAVSFVNGKLDIKVLPRQEQPQQQSQGGNQPYTGPNSATPRAAQDRWNDALSRQHVRIINGVPFGNRDNYNPPGMSDVIAGFRNNIGRVIHAENRPTDWDARFELANRIVEFDAEKNPDFIPDAKTKFRMAAFAIGKRGPDNQPIDDTAEKFEYLDPRGNQSFWMASRFKYQGGASNNGNRDFKQDFDRYMSAYPALRSEGHRRALTNLVTAARASNYMTPEDFASALATLKYRPAGADAFKAATTRLAEQLQAKSEAIRQADTAGERPSFDTGSTAGAPTQVATPRNPLDALKTSPTVTSAPKLYTEKQRDTWKRRHWELTGALQAGTLTNRERKQAAEDIRYYERKLAEYEKQNAEKSEAAGLLSKYWDESKYRRAPKGSDKGGEFVSQGLREAGSLAIGNAAWMGTAAMVSRYLPGPHGTVARIALNWVVPAAAAMGTQYVADRMLGNSGEMGSAAEETGRFVGSIGGLMAGSRFGRSPLSNAAYTTAGLVLGDQAGKLSGALIDRYGQQTAARIKAKYGSAAREAKARFSA